MPIVRFGHLNTNHHYETVFELNNRKLFRSYFLFKFYISWHLLNFVDNLGIT